MADKRVDELVRRLALSVPALALIIGCGMLAANMFSASAPVSATPGEERPRAVLIDAGHGGEDGGAVGTDTGVIESGLNLDYALALKSALEERGMQVVLTREDERALAATKRQDLARRREIMAECGADITVSLHMNKFADRSISGPMVFYMKGSEEGEKLAGFVIASVCEAIGRDARHANPGDYFVIRENPMPAIIVECGFLSNSSDEALLQTAEHRDALILGVAKGIEEYFENMGTLLGQ